MKNILITLGCSFTQGDGCWDLETIKAPEFEGNSFNELSFEQHSLLFSRNLNRFLQLGWPSQLQEKLKYDELYNLGFGGAAPSHSVKMFLEDIYYRDFTDCNVLVIQLLSFHHRISFYRNGVLNTFQMGGPLVDEYLKEINLDTNNNSIYFGDLDDTTLEAYFYMKVMKELCENKGWNFLFAGVRGDEPKHMVEYKDNMILKPNFIAIKNLLKYSHKDETYGWCAHPTENIYNRIASDMYKWIVTHKTTIPKGNASEFKKERILPKSYSRNPNR